MKARRTARTSEGVAAAASAPKNAAAGRVARVSLADVLTWLGAVLLIAVASMRVLASFTPDLWWNPSPATAVDQEGQLLAIQFGPLGSAITDVMAILSLALVLMGAMVSRRRVHGVMVLLWAAGAGFALLHAGESEGSMRLGGHWIGATALGVAATHLAGLAGMRRVILAAFIALVIPLTIKAAYHFTIQHDYNVAGYESDPAGYAASRGWEPGSPEITRYEKRLHQREANAGFITANLFGSVMLTLSITAGGAAIGLMMSRRRLDRRLRWVGPVVGLMALGGAGATVLTFSKGAAATMVAASAAIPTWLFFTRLAPWAGRLWRPMFTGLIALGIVAVIGRTLVLGVPDSPEAERSLLFRYHYWQAAVRMIGDEDPTRGIGPGEFQTKYPMHKDPLSPEQPADPHNVYLAFVTSLGVSGAAWCVMLLVMAMRAADLAGSATIQTSTQLSIPEQSLPPPLPIQRPGVETWLVLSAAILLSYGSWYFVEISAYGVGGFGLIALSLLITGVAYKLQRDRQSVGALVMLALALLFPFVPYYGLPEAGIFSASLIMTGVMVSSLIKIRVFDHASTRLGLAAAAAALLIHGSIEMSLTNNMSGPVLMAVLGLAAGWGASERSAARAAAVGETKGATPPAEPGAEGRHGGGRLAALTGGGATAMVLVVLVGTAFAVLRPTSRRAVSLRDAAEAYLAGRPDIAAELLGRAAERPFDAALAVKAVQVQLQAAVTARTPATRQAAVIEAIDRLKRLTGEHPDQPSLRRSLLQLAMEIKRFTGGGGEDPLTAEEYRRAVDALLALDPYGAYSHLLAADALHGIGDVERAAGLYRKSLDLAEKAYLDPIPALSGEQMRRATQRGGVRGGPAGVT